MPKIQWNAHIASLDVVCSSKRSAVLSREVHGCSSVGGESSPLGNKAAPLADNCVGAGQELGVLEKFEIPFPSHACGAEKILDDNTGTALYTGITRGRLMPGFV
jgi:hypothetical protein